MTERKVEKVIVEVEMWVGPNGRRYDTRDKALRAFDLLEAKIAKTGELAARYRSIIELTGLKMMDKEIAKRLGVSPTTISTDRRYLGIPALPRQVASRRKGARKGWEKRWADEAKKLKKIGVHS